MEIKTKYDIHQSVFVCMTKFEDYQVEWVLFKDSIRSIEYNGARVTYRFNELSQWYPEEDIFSTKEAAQAECDRRNGGK